VRRLGNRQTLLAGGLLMAAGMTLALGVIALAGLAVFVLSLSLRKTT
jgi:dipeptide/tripeptide permease